MSAYSGPFLKLLLGEHISVKETSCHSQTKKCPALTRARSCDLLVHPKWCGDPFANKRCEALLRNFSLSTAR